MAALRLFCRRLLHEKCDLRVNVGSTSVIFNRFLNYASKEYNDKDPAPLFFNKEVQYLLQQLTRINLNRVYKKRKTGEQKLEAATYKFITDDQLQSMLKEAEAKTNELLQMPPILKVRQPVDRVISKDPALQGLDTASFVFTDITFGVSNINRLIVVRETDGTLRHADWPLRDRVNEVYFAIPGRELKKPLMFEDAYFNRLLSRKEYEFILDRSCLQFEPDDPNYQKLVTITYQHINDSNEFEALRCTRHFGPLAFFLAWHKDTDNLMLDLIQTSHINEANTLLQLYAKINNVEFDIKDFTGTEMVEKYIKEFSNKRASLELALQAYKELEYERKSIEQDIKHAHGIV